tara:strand:+ start:28 stop:462 length:435 start_codon:yes stop_codon:yes gene_type:complete
MTTLDFIKNQLSLEFAKLPKFSNNKTTIVFGNLTYSFFNGSILECVFEDGQRFLDGKPYSKKGVSTQFTCSYKTPKGYISSKKLPVKIKDVNSVTLQEVTELLKFNTDAVKNTFDPFWHENEAKRKSNIGWNAVASNHLQSDCR